METESNSFINETSCPYFHDGRISRTEFLRPDPRVAKDFHRFLAAGYRRLGPFFYRNICTDCSKCIPLRIITERYRASKSQKRTWHKNRDVVMKIGTDPSISVEQLELFRKYEMTKHRRRAGDISEFADMLASIQLGFEKTIVLNYYLQAELIGVSILDEGENSLSANYCYYDTGFPDRRLGVYTILKEILLALSMQKKYYYLGFYIEDNGKMSYKKFFRPNQILYGVVWRDFID